MMYKQDSDVNKLIWEDSHITKKVKQWNEIFKPESVILSMLKSRLKDAIMLDIGCGAGRTTHYFAGYVKEYTGIDYSRSLIAECRDKFSDRKNIHFEVCDVRDMKVFPDNSFDFILFSFNGIDSINHNERITAFNEIRRVLKSGSLLCFSTHNIFCLDKLFAVKNIKNIKALYKYLILKYSNINYKQLIIKDWAIINEPIRNMILKQYYINPNYSLSQLKEVGFHSIRVFSHDEGNEITNELEKAKDYWLYYLCGLEKPQ